MTNPQTDEIERVARVLFDFERAKHMPTWENELPERHDYMRRKATAAIAAMGRENEVLRHLVRQYVDPFDVAPADHALVLAIGTDDEAGYRAALTDKPVGGE